MHFIGFACSVSNNLLYQETDKYLYSDKEVYLDQIN